MSVGTASPSKPITSHFAGRIVDLDSHEMVTMQRWASEFGGAGERMLVLADGPAGRSARNGMYRPDLEADDAEIDYDSVWKLKGPGAPSGIDLRRRPAVMDLQGFDRQFVFPTFALVGMILVSDPNAHNRLGFDPDVDRVELGRAAVAAYNEWAGRMTREVDGRRMRPVGALLTESVDQMMADAEAMLSDGVRGIWISAGLPPADLSPADRALDPFYRMLADADVPLLSHLGTEQGLLASQQWSANCPEFVPSGNSSVEFPLQPYVATTIHLVQENFLIPMVLGGVFERHPNLRFGIIECGAHWLGHTAEMLDLWKGQFTRLDKTLTMKPSEYINRNVRVTPFVFEPVDMYFDRYPGLADTFCYSSDFPHREGGEESLRIFAETLAHTDESLQEKFFVSNAEWLMPN